MTAKKRPKNGLKANLIPDAKTGIIYYRKMKNGKRINISSGTTNKKTANKLHSKLEWMGLQILYSPDLNKPKNIKLNDLKDKFLKANQKNWSHHTYRAYKNKITHYIYRGLTGSESNKATIRRHLRACINWGIANNYDAGKYLEKGNTNSGIRNRIATEDEIKLLFGIPGKMGDLIRFIYYTGVRIGEACTVRKENYRDGIIDVWGKGGHRLVRVSSLAYPYLHNYDEWMGRNDKPITRSNLEHYLDENYARIRKEIGVGDVHFHDLRKTFGTHFLIRGGRLEELQLLLGHSNYKTTQDHYAFMNIYDLTNPKLVEWIFRLN